MLKSLQTQGIGPFPRLDIEFAPRLNIVTGDNGLGKSFLLDIAWWCLTRKWPIELNPKLNSGYMARPLPSNQAASSITFSFTGKVSEEKYTSKFDPSVQAWTGRSGRPANPGLVLYAQVDGSYSLWDPARNYWRKTGNIDTQERQPAYVFSTQEVWNGLENENNVLCNGLIRDWALWQKEKGTQFELLKTALGTLSPDKNEIIQPGALTRISLDDVRDMPTICMPYQQDVPILFASAGIRRILALAYLLVWAWQEHVQASKLLGQATSNQIILLTDEIEAHLHPRWQRTILSSLLKTVRQFIGDVNIDIQIIAATHSPLILASLEPLFGVSDAWFDINLDATKANPSVHLSKMPWTRRGDISNWLTSEAFDLKLARAAEAEPLIEQASAALQNEHTTKEQFQDIDTRLRQLLSDTDPFWTRWRYIYEKRGLLK
jgi:hypothetical protein